MAQALSAGVRFFQYRNKSGSRRSIYDAAHQLAGIARHSDALFILNDHPDIAAAVEADGVHLGQDDLPIAAARKLLGAGKIIGISTHSREQAVLAGLSGADYIGFGPIFPTRTKDAGEVQGVETLKQIKQSVTIPVIAIGGITHENCGVVLQAGADGVAVISAVLAAVNLQESARRIIKVITESRIHNRK
jgi:thiamine-phosphate pyrophosphorylase